MKTIRWYCNTGFTGCIHDGEIEMPEEATEKDMEDAAFESMMECLDWGWEIVEGEEPDD